MRNPGRIDLILEMVGEYWKKTPDWRFFQLMYNVMSTCDKDPFYVEDSELKDLFENLYKKAV